MRNAVLPALVAAILTGCGAHETKADTPPSELVGAWCCKASVGNTAEPGERRDIDIAIVIRADGNVTGTVGDARLEDCVYQLNRGSVGRALHIKTDHIILGGRISGPMHEGDTGESRVFTLPFNLADGQLKGTIMELGAWTYPNPLTRQLSLERKTEARQTSSMP